MSRQAQNEFRGTDISGCRRAWTLDERGSIFFLMIYLKGVEMCKRLLFHQFPPLPIVLALPAHPAAIAPIVRTVSMGHSDIQINSKIEASHVKPSWSDAHPTLHDFSVLRPDPNPAATGCCEFDLYIPTLDHIPTIQTLNYPFLRHSNTQLPIR